MAKDERVVKAKRKCCKDAPRCKRCPVVCKRLVRAGLAERVDERHFRLSVTLSKKEYRAARAG